MIPPQLLPWVIGMFLLLGTDGDTFFMVGGIAALFFAIRTVQAVLVQPKEALEQRLTDIEDMDAAAGPDARRANAAVVLVQNMMGILLTIYCAWYLKHPALTAGCALLIVLRIYDIRTAMGVPTVSDYARRLFTQHGRRIILFRSLLTAGMVLLTGYIRFFMV